MSLRIVAHLKNIGQNLFKAENPHIILGFQEKGRVSQPLDQSTQNLDEDISQLQNPQLVIIVAYTLEMVSHRFIINQNLLNLVLESIN